MTPSTTIDSTDVRLALHEMLSAIFGVDTAATPTSARLDRRDARGHSAHRR